MADRNCNLLYAINTLSTVVKNTCCGWEINIFLSFFLLDLPVFWYSLTDKKKGTYERPGGTGPLNNSEFLGVSKHVILCRGPK